MRKGNGGMGRKEEQVERTRRRKKRGMWRVEAESSAAGRSTETTAAPELLPRPERPGEGGAAATGGLDVNASALSDGKRYGIL